MGEPKLMPSYWELAEEVTHLHGNLDKLQAENTSLRELVRDMWTWKEALPFGMRAEMRGRMRELGLVS